MSATNVYTWQETFCAECRRRGTLLVYKNVQTEVLGFDGVETALIAVKRCSMCQTFHYPSYAVVEGEHAMPCLTPEGDAVNTPQIIMHSMRQSVRTDYLKDLHMLVLSGVSFRQRIHSTAENTWLQACGGEDAGEDILKETAKGLYHSVNCWVDSCLHAYFTWRAFDFCRLQPSLQLRSIECSETKLKETMKKIIPLKTQFLVEKYRLRLPQISDTITETQHIHIVFDGGEKCSRPMCSYAKDDWFCTETPDNAGKQFCKYHAELMKHERDLPKDWLERIASIGRRRQGRDTAETSYTISLRDTSTRYRVPKSAIPPEMIHNLRWKGTNKHLTKIEWKSEKNEESRMNFVTKPKAKGRPKRTPAPGEGNMDHHNQEDDSPKTKLRGKTQRAKQIRTLSATKLEPHRSETLSRVLTPSDPQTSNLQLVLGDSSLNDLSDDQIAELVLQKQLDVTFDCNVSKEIQRPGLQKRTAGTMVICDGDGKILCMKEMLQTEGKMMRLEALRDYLTPLYAEWQSLPPKHQSKIMMTFIHDDACSLFAMLKGKNRTCGGPLYGWMAKGKWIVDEFHYCGGPSTGIKKGHTGIFCCANCSPFTKSNGNAFARAGALENACEQTFAAYHRLTRCVNNMSSERFQWMYLEFWAKWNRNKATNLKLGCDATRRETWKNMRK